MFHFVHTRRPAKESPKNLLARSVLRLALTRLQPLPEPGRTLGALDLLVHLARLAGELHRAGRKYRDHHCQAEMEPQEAHRDQHRHDPNDQHAPTDLGTHQQPRRSIDPGHPRLPTEPTDTKSGGPERSPPLEAEVLW